MMMIVALTTMMMMVTTMVMILLNVLDDPNEVERWHSTGQHRSEQCWRCCSDDDDDDDDDDFAQIEETLQSAKLKNCKISITIGEL